MYAVPRWAIVAMLSAVSTLVAWAAGQTAWGDTLRERGHDTVMMLGAAHIQAPIAPGPVFVDIDRATLAVQGAWPWRRDKIAELLTVIRSADPIVVGIDILFEGSDDSSPASIARYLATETGDASLEKLAESLVDGDRALAAAINGQSIVLGLALDPTVVHGFEGVHPIVTRARFNPEGLWQAAGLIGPPSSLRSSSMGLGVLALPGDIDGVVRRVPVVAVAEQRLVPGFAVEVARLARQAQILILSERPRQIAIGASVLPLSADGMFRLVPTPRDRGAVDTVSAAQLLSKDAAALAMLRGRIVILGSSAPEAGGLRLDHDGMLAPASQLQATAVRQMLSGVTPLRPNWLTIAEVIAALAATATAAWSGASLHPARAGAIAILLVALWLIISLIAFISWHYLADPLLVTEAALLASASAMLMAASDVRRREAAIRRRFEQHLAPAVVRRLVAEPGVLKLAGERRPVTAMFTDIEGFTTMADRAEPEALIAALDGYFDGITRLVIEHGGLIDKIVGDAVHALFNVPLDQPGHAAKAVDCSIAIALFGEAYRKESGPAAIGFGATCIGIETGPAIVGDVGGSRKLDYTAHGSAINTAARLEAATRELGTRIAIGPGTTALLPAHAVRPLGELKLRGLNAPIAVYGLWPGTFSAADRHAYLSALAEARTNKASLQALEVLLSQHPDDLALERLIAKMQSNTI
jgi:adenylate cyclase